VNWAQAASLRQRRYCTW